MHRCQGILYGLAYGWRFVLTFQLQGPARAYRDRIWLKLTVDGS